MVSAENEARAAGTSADAPTPARGRRARFLDSAPRLSARVAALVGVLSLIDVIWPHHYRLISAFSPIVPAPARDAAEAVVIVSGFLLLRIAAGLRKRKRAAWRIAVATCVAISIADLLRDERRPIAAAVTVVLLVILLSAHSRFTALEDPSSRWFAARVGVQILVVAVVYGTVLLYLPGHVPARVSFWERLWEVIRSLVGLGGQIPIVEREYANLVSATLLGFGMLAATCTLVLLLRPHEPRAELSHEDEARLRELLHRHGSIDSLGYFALRRDKSVVWSPSGKAAITYRVVLGVALASGDPIGDPEAWPGAIGAYRELVDRFGWTPAIMGCSELGATVFRREYGLAALALGDEAILDVGTFTLSGRSMRGVRQACARVERAGYTVSVRRTGEVSPDELRQLADAGAAWRTDAVERGYSMALSRLGDPADPDCVIATARQEGQLRGLLHFVPWSGNGLSLDLMRRDHSADNGLNEYMIAAVMRDCPKLGVEHVSLNFAVFREALERGARIGAGPVLRLWRRVLLLASRWWQIESLYRFNAKFQPRWQPRFISYPAARDLPRVALAALEAEAFLVRPHALKRMLGRA